MRPWARPVGAVLFALVTASGCGDNAEHLVSTPHSTQPTTTVTTGPTVHTAAPGAGEVDVGVVTGSVPDRSCTPQSPTQYCSADDTTRYTLDPTSLETLRVTKTEALVVAGTDQWSVSISLDGPSTTLFATLTTRLATSHQRLALVKNGTVVTAPAVQTPILDGRIQVSGNLTHQSAERLALMLVQ